MAHPQQQHRLSLGADPVGLPLQLGRQLPLELRQGRQGGGAIGAEGIGLDHADIPAAGAALERHRAEGQLQERRR